ncbi:MAG: glycosyltransferase family 4 protein [Burkholderiales bacterium]
MNILFVHQNFPGQFKHLAPALAQRGHEVVAMTMQKVNTSEWQGVKLVPYTASRGTTPNVHPWVSDFETKTIRGEACFRAALKMKESGFDPDVIIAHHGWGESLFLKDVWPAARLGIYCEFFYQAHGADVGFDPEFPASDAGEVCRLRLKNLNNLLHFEVADAGISPTHWQASTFPERFRSRITVVHDGIDTHAIRPGPAVSLTLNGKLVLTKQDEVITFVNRNLEPYRGYHIFMRALPEILKRRPRARVLIVGGDDVSYGARHENGQKWKDIFAAEVRPQIADADWARAHFLGNIPYQHFIPLLQLSTVHVYLTYPFVLSWSLLEAMSAGCAIVASDTQPLREAIRHDETGRLVDFFDVAGLANEVCALLDDPAARQRLGANARAFAQANYDLKKVCLPKQLKWVEALAEKGLPG